jgi:hypothetical protein
MLRHFTLAVLGAASLAACSGGQGETTAAAEAAAPAAAPVNPAPAGLWAVDIEGADGRIASRARVCDDGSLGAAFARSLPPVGDEPCLLAAPTVLHADMVTAKCTVGGAEYVASTDPQGELGRVFTLDVSLKPATGSGAELKQTARVRRVGDCPTDWVPGDAAAPQSHDIANVFTGATKTGMSVN